MGIGGSGISAIAMLAKKMGYVVNGCDLSETTAYSNKLNDYKIPFLVGHDPRHLKDIDVLVVTPAVYYQSNNHAEYVEAKNIIPVITWQEFLGTFLHRDKVVICVAGTHGKSTTTALATILFADAGLDPTATVGATVKALNANFRYGNGKLFITEADEFFDNFLHYRPEVIILNNIEMDHPDFFKNEKQLFESYKKFVSGLIGKRVLIANQNSSGIGKLINLLDKTALKQIKVIGYSLSGNKKYFEADTEIVGCIRNQTSTKTSFTVDGSDTEFSLGLPGIHNVSNALGVIALSQLYDIKIDVVDNTLRNFEGIGRRLELIGEKNGVTVYDDYAHHPTAIKATIQALRQKFPTSNLITVVEAHSYSRTKLLLKEYKGVFGLADKVIIGPIFRARDKSDFGVSEESIAKATKHKNIYYTKDMTGILKKVKENLEKDTVILIMGAGESYIWSKKIYEAI